MKHLLMLVGLMLLASACAPTAQQEPTVMASDTSAVWLMAAPTTRDFPEGALSTPQSRWTKISQYPTFALCNSSADQMHNQTGRLVDCVASDSPTLKATE